MIDLPSLSKNVEIVLVSGADMEETSFLEQVEE